MVSWTLNYIETRVTDTEEDALSPNGMACFESGTESLFGGRSLVAALGCLLAYR